jgi:hypothetical protein
MVASTGVATSAVMAPDADERLACKARLATCRRCRTSLADISVIPPLPAGLDESVFAAPIEAVPTLVPDTLLPACCRPPHGNEPATAGSPLVWACSQLAVRLR